MMKNRTSISACPQIVPTIPCINYSASLNLLDVLLSPILLTNSPGIFYMQFTVMLKGPPFNVLKVSGRALNASYYIGRSGSALPNAQVQFKVMLKGPPFNVLQVSRRALIAYSPNQFPWNLLYAV